ncbi:serine hydrolase [Actinomycetes bacterium]|nr:serine hydrolase [Actinomycetes bacterium]
MNAHAKALVNEVTPDAAGMDPKRLRTLDEHFERYVDDGRLPGFHLVVSRHGKVAHQHRYGMRDVEGSLPIEDDTMYRIYSMTKPITSVALMMLVEEGKLLLNDPVSNFIPSFGSSRVWRGGSVLKPVTEPVTEPMLVAHLLTHTAGLTYGWMYQTAVDDLYRRAGYEGATTRGTTLEKAVDDWAQLPLLFQPGTEWNYSVATDVVGRIVEVASGQTLEEFFAQRIFAPLGMHDTGFFAPEDKVHRLAGLYQPDPATRRAKRLDNMGNAATHRPTFLSGGGGLVSTAYDYHRFLQMLANDGELDGARILSPRTVRLMTSNHLPNDADITEYGRPLDLENAYDGFGFGLGFSVLLNPARAKVLGSVGDFGWGGAASTTFWIDRNEGIIAAFYTQLLPSSTWPLRPYFKNLVYQALVD